MVAINIDRFVKRYGAVEVVHDISFDIKPEFLFFENMRDARANRDFCAAWPVQPYPFRERR